MSHPGDDADRGRLTAARAERYAALPAKTRDLIEGMRDEDAANLAALLKLMREKNGIDQIKQGVEMAQAAAMMGRLGKSGVLLMLAIFAAISTIGGGIAILGGWFKFGGKP